MSSRN